MRTGQARWAFWFKGEVVLTIHMDNKYFDCPCIDLNFATTDRYGVYRRAQIKPDPKAELPPILWYPRHKNSFPKEFLASLLIMGIE